MGVVNFLNKLLGVTGTNGETIVIDIPASIYYKELAIYTAELVFSKCSQHGRNESVQQGETCKRSGLLFAERSTE